MVGIYLSGTGNTKYCIERLLSLLAALARIIPLESGDVIKEIEKNNTMILAYPIQFSNAPYMVRDFICRNRTLWSGKKVLCMATMGGV